MRLSFLIIICFILVSCNKKISNTKWVYRFGENIGDSLIFYNNNNYNFFRAELGGFSTGIYKIYGDTLFLIEPNKVNNTSKAIRYTFLLNKQKLYPQKIEEEMKNKWIELNFNFNPSYIFYKVQE